LKSLVPMLPLLDFAKAMLAGLPQSRVSAARQQCPSSLKQGYADKRSQSLVATRRWFWMAVDDGLVQTVPCSDRQHFSPATDSQRQIHPLPI